MDDKSCLDGGSALLACAHVQRLHIQLCLCKDLGDLHEKSLPVVGVHLDLRQVLATLFLSHLALPLHVDEPGPLRVRQVDHVDAVCPVDGKTSSPGDKAHDLISRHRIAAPGETDRHVVDALHHNAALGLGDVHLVPGCFRHLLQHHLVGELLLVLLAVLLHEPVHHLALLQPAVADGRQHRIPVPEAVLLLDDLLILWLHDVGQIDGLGLAVAGDELLAPDDVVLLELLLKPLIDLVLGLGALDNVQPVTAGPPGILGGEDLDPVSVLDLVVDVDQLAVDPGSHHLVAHRAVDGVGEIHRRGAGRQALHIPARGKAVDVLREEIQISLEHA